MIVSSMGPSTFRPSHGDIGPSAFRPSHDDLGPSAFRPSYDDLVIFVGLSVLGLRPHDDSFIYGTVSFLALALMTLSFLQVRWF